MHTFRLCSTPHLAVFAAALLATAPFAACAFSGAAGKYHGNARHIDGMWRRGLERGLMQHGETCVGPIFAISTWQGTRREIGKAQADGSSFGVAHCLALRGGGRSRPGGGGDKVMLCV